MARINDEGLRAIGTGPNDSDAEEGEPDCPSTECSVPDTARTVALAAEPGTQDATVAEAAQAAPVAKATEVARKIRTARKKDFLPDSGNVVADQERV